MGSRRRRGVALVVLVCASLSSSACLVASIHPFFGDATIATDPSLEGTWASEDGDATFAIEPGEWSSYRVAFTDRNGTQQFTAHATRIGDRRFVDVLPAHGYEHGELFVPLHVVFLVESTEDTLTVRALNYDWFARAKKAGRLASIGGVFDAKQNVVLTGATASIRSFLRRPGDAMFGPPAKLTRKR